MALFKVKPVEQTSEIGQKILRRRMQILVHSCIYYELDSNLISDSTWSQWAKELVELQDTHPQVASKIRYHKEFVNFDASTGMNLPLRDQRVLSIANQLLRYDEDLKRRNENG